MTDAKKNDDTHNENREETLAERSARLEAEAAAMNNAANKDQDPLAPEQEPELYGEGDDLDMSENNTQVLALQKELDDAKDKMLRAVAEAENTRRRAVKEREDAQKYSISGFSKDLVTVADNLRRALEAIPAELAEQHDQVKNLVDGIEATERELLRAFDKNGIKKIEPSLEGEGEIFDPNKHEVMFEAPGSGKPPGTIVQVVETGYTLHDRLLRPARVGVAKDEGGDQTTGHIDTEA